MNEKRYIYITGNPNCGKSTIFSLLTGTEQATGNWHGVTVEQKAAPFSSRWKKWSNKPSKEMLVVDLPGIYSLYNGESYDEQIAQQSLHSSKHSLIINVIDVTNIKRSLYLTLQLLELEKPLLIVLNKADLIKAKKTSDFRALQKNLECDIAVISARNCYGLRSLLKAIKKQLDTPRTSINPVYIYPQNVHHAITWLINELNITTQEALKIVESMIIYTNGKKLALQTEYKLQLENICGQDPELALIDARYEAINDIARHLPLSQHKAPPQKNNLADFLDNIFLSNILGIPIFIAVMYLLFTFSTTIASIFQDFFELSAKALFIVPVATVLKTLNLGHTLLAAVCTGIGIGIQTVATFIPVIGALYLILSFIEESGYMSRAAFLLEHLMNKIGLQGKALIPLVVGFGCNVPAIAATRIINNYKQRLATIMMTPFLTCSARLSVFTAMGSVFFAQYNSLIILLLYIVGILCGILTGYIIKLLLGTSVASSNSILEFPQYNLPPVNLILRKTFTRLKEFIFGAGKLIVLTCVVLHLINSVGIDGATNNKSTTKSLLVHICKYVTPIFEPIGIHNDNWPATVGLVTGILAKEVVIGSLNMLYTTSQESHNDIQDTQLTVYSILLDAVRSIKDNVLSLFNSNAEEELSSTAASEMLYRFSNAAAAFAYLLFILLYFPCISVFATIKEELGYKWAIVSCFWSTSLAYFVAMIFYQGTNYIMQSS